MHVYVVITAPHMTWLGFIVRSALCSGHGCEYIHALANLTVRSRTFSQ